MPNDAANITTAGVSTAPARIPSLNSVRNSTTPSRYLTRNGRTTMRDCLILGNALDSRRPSIDASEVIDLPLPRPVVLCGIGGDSHSVGLLILHSALRRFGCPIRYLGTQNTLAEVCAAAVGASAVLVSNMDGHARYWLRDLPTVRLDHPDDGARWYLGGHPTMQAGPDEIAELMSLGFDRVITWHMPAEAVVEMLREECPDLVFGPGDVPAAGPTPGPGALLSVPCTLPPRADREEVLAHWHTGAAAGDLGVNAAVLGGRTSLSEAQHRAGQRREVLVHPRCGVARVEDQRTLLHALREAGADVLSLQIDSLTRNNAYAEVELALKEGSIGRAGIGGELNGYPAVNQGVAALRAVTAEFSDVPMQVRHSTRDPRLLAEITFAGGVAAYEGGALTYNLPYYRDYPPAESVQAWQYVDALAGRYHKQYGTVIDREFFGVLTACLVPPGLAIAVTVLEALLAAEQGVRSVSLGYAEQGNRAQDVAAIAVLRSIGRLFLNRYGHPEVAVHTVFHQYMGAFPSDEAKARELVSGSAATARRSGATRVMVKTPAEALRIPTWRDNADAIALVRAELARADPEPDDPDAAREAEILEAEAGAVLDAVLRAGSGDPATAAVAGLEQGLIDIPFSPSQWNAGLAVTVRDADGAVRFADPGRIPLPADVRAHHRDQVERRRRRDRRHLSELVEADVLRVARGDWDRWPLRGTDCWIGGSR